MGYVLVTSTSSVTNGEDLLQGKYVSNTSYRDEWTLIRTLPTSGYELAYNESSWNGYVEIANNCYAYAINNQVVPGSNWLWARQQPGAYSNSFFDNVFTEKAIRLAAISDFAEYESVSGTSMTFAAIDRYATCPAGTYKVALVIDNSSTDGNGPDYHWYRQDADGFWSHKPGITKLSDKDASGNFIIDPQLAARGRYTIFAGYYAVTPWNNLFTEVSNPLFYCNGNLKTYNQYLEYFKELASATAIGTSAFDLKSIDWSEAS